MPNERRHLTSNDIAREAGVSQTTVSLVMRGAADGRISAAVQEHVRSVARRLGYRPSLSARSLRSGRAHMLGLVIPNVTDPFFAAVFRGAQAAGSERGCVVAMVESLPEALLSDAIAATRSDLLDGIVICAPDPEQLRLARTVGERLVVVDGGAPRGVSSVRYDIAGGVRLLVEHLERLGHRRFAHVGGASENPGIVQRSDEVRRLLGKRLVASVRTSFELDAARDDVAAFLARRRGATAVICDSDSMAAAAHGAARSIGLSVPGDISLCAFNDTSLSRALDLTTVSLPAAEAGRLGAQMLLDLIDGAGRSRRVLPVTLVERTSTAPPAAGEAESGPFIQTVSGRRVNPLHPSVDQIDAGDIAQALSNQCRFGGHSRVFYSVAQHSAIVSDLARAQGAGPQAALAALMHDAAEAYLVDLPHPLKHRSELGTHYRRAEERLEQAIRERFALPDDMALIKRIDRALLATERRAFSEVAWHWPELDGVEPLDLALEPWEPARAAREFRARFERLQAATAPQ